MPSNRMVMRALRPGPPRASTRPAGAGHPPTFLYATAIAHFLRRADTRMGSGLRGSTVGWAKAAEAIVKGTTRVPPCPRPHRNAARVGTAEPAPCIKRSPGPPLPTLRLIPASFSGVRLALRIDDLLELAQDPHAGQHLGEAAVGLALFPDRRDELAVLELDAVHRDVDLRDVDLVVLAVAQVVVEGLVGAVVADVAEEGAERAVIVEGQRQGEDRARRHLGDDAHVHRDIELRMDRPLHRIAIRDGLARLVLKQVDRMGGMVPEQMIGPAARISRRIDVLAPEEIGLHVHLLDLELALLDPLVDPLVARIEAPHMAPHGDDAGLLGDLHQLLGVLDAVGHRDLDQHMLAGPHDLLALAEMHLGRRGEDDRVGPLDAFREVAGVMRDAVFLGHRRRRVLVAADERGDLNALDTLQGIEMLLAKGALAGDANLHRHHFPLRTSRWVTRAAARFILGVDFDLALPLAAPFRFSRMMCPTAVLEAGTV